MSRQPRRDDAQGPFRAYEVPEESRYELSHGHPVECAPAGGRHAIANAAGAMVLASDPAVDSAGVDAGYSPSEDTLRAPDLSVGGVPRAPGWIKGVPPLAVEYVDSGQDEEKLADKIADLLSAGTQLVWVVRLAGPSRVEVHERGKAVRMMLPGQLLEAPGVLQNPVPVQALYEGEAALQATLSNLLQRRGYQDLEAVRSEGRTEGRAEAVLTLLAARGIGVPDAERSAILACRDPATLERWLVRAATAERLDQVLP
ncbi:MAG: Uma2 family endonuclease [Myxococcota bacterium]